VGKQLTEEQMARKRRVSAWLGYWLRRFKATHPDKQDQEDFAAELGCSPQALGDWLHYKGGPRGPTLDTIFMLRKIGANLEAVVTRDPTPEELASPVPAGRDDIRTSAAG
jgi:transcriptional regulator with XRE-family HTH domain